MTSTEILARFAAVVEEVVGIPARDVTPTKSFTDDLDIDSLSMVEIATAAEDAFGVTIPDSVLGDLRTVADAVDFITRAGVAA
ncbi:MAG TPA: acyl carrier protein [Mycobacteriales bacterium]|nr:acyl carrier protein [Mycobacteriales bacterium]